MAYMRSRNNSSSIRPDTMLLQPRAGILLQADEQPMRRTQSNPSGSMASRKMSSIRPDTMLAQPQTGKLLQAEQPLYARAQGESCNIESDDALHRELSSLGEGSGPIGSLSGFLHSIHEHDDIAPLPEDSDEQSREQQGAQDELLIQPQACDPVDSSASC